MKKRLFESYFRKKKVPLVITECCGYFFSFILFLIVDMIVSLSCSQAMEQHNSGEVILPPISHLSVRVLDQTVDLICIVIFLTLLFSLCRVVRYRSNLNRCEKVSVVFVDMRCCWYSTFFLVEESTNFNYLFLTEPYIHKVQFILDSFQEEPYLDDIEKLHFNFPIHKSYKREKDYNWYKLQYMSDDRKTALKSISTRFSNFSYQKNKGRRNWEKYTYYVTFEKAQILNKIFDLMEVPFFDVVVNTKQHYLISIHPIEGREYPPEVPELLDKINKMYP